MKKKLLAVLLVICMVMTFMPTVALAVTIDGKDVTADATIESVGEWTTDTTSSVYTVELNAETDDTAITELAKLDAEDETGPKVYGEDGTEVTDVTAKYTAADDTASKPASLALTFAEGKVPTETTKYYIEVVTGTDPDVTKTYVEISVVVKVEIKAADFKISDTLSLEYTGASLATTIEAAITPPQDITFAANAITYTYYSKPADGGELGAPVAPTDAGTYVVKAAVTEGDTYKAMAAAEIGEVTIAKAERTITSVSATPATLDLDAKEPGTAQITVTGDNAAKETPVYTYTSSDESVATVSEAGVVTPLKAGTVIITVKANETKNYAAYTATDKTATVTVKKLLDQTIEFTTGADTISDGAVAKKTTDAAFTIEAAVSEPSTDGGAVTYASDNTKVATVNSSSGEVTIVGAGEANITATAAETATHKAASISYKLTVSKVALVIDEVVVAGKTYNGKTDATVSSVTFKEAGDTPTELSAQPANTDYNAAAVFTDANAGEAKEATVTVTLTEAGQKKYSLSETTKTTTAKIAKATGTATAAALLKTDENATCTVALDSISGLPAGESFEFSVPNDATYTNIKTAAVEGSTLTVTAENGKSANTTENVTVTATSTNYTVTITVTVKYTDKTPVTIKSLTATGKVYDGKDEITVSNFVLEGVEAGDAGKVTIADSAKAAVSSKNVGEYNVISLSDLTLEGDSATSYDISATANVKLDTPIEITAKELTVSGVTATGREYDGTNKVAISAVALTGVVGGDTVSVDTTDLKGTVSAAAPATYDKVTVPNLSLTGADAGNYSLTQPTDAVSASVTISKKSAFTESIAQTINPTKDAPASISVAAKVPSDAGTATYDVAAGAYTNLTNVTVSEAGVLTLTWKDAGELATSGTDTITVNVGSSNYADSTITVTFTYTSKTAASINKVSVTITGTGTQTVEVTGGTVTATSADTSIATATADENTVTITGVAAGTTTVTITTAENDDYSAGSFTVNVTVNASTPSTGGGTYVPPTQDKTETTTSPDGTTTTTTTKPDGSKEVAVKAPDGTTADVKVDASGKTQAEVSVSAEAADKGSVTLPIPAVPVASSSAAASTVKVNVPAASQGKAMAVTVPTQTAPTGTVAIIVKADGTEQIVKKSVVTEDGLYVPIDGDAELKIVNNTKSFTDTSGHWASEAISFVSGRELYQGMGDGTFAPGGDMNRAMLVTVLHRLEDMPKGGGVSFDDVASGQYYADAVAWGAGSGIVQGNGSGFDPNGTVTRQQLATFLYRYAKTVGADTTASGSMSGFNDAGKVQSWASDAMSWAIGAGLINGKGAGVLDPEGNTTRAEVATILMRFCQFMAK